MSCREFETGKRRTEEHPSLIQGRRISILHSGQNVSRIEAKLLTRMKTENTGLINIDNARWRTDLLHVFLPAQAYLIYTAW